MTITTSTADALEALATQIQAATAADPSLDTQMLQLITEPMQTIDGRVAPTGFKYTLNVTNALLLRAKHWYMEVNEYNTTNPNVSAPKMAQCGLVLVTDQPLGWTWSANSYGATIGLATAAAICLSWARIVRLWVVRNYPLAVTQPAPVA
jgi:hypothetical protein